MFSTIKVLVPVAFLAFALPNLFAQEIVHAMAGSLIGIDRTSSSLTLRMPDQSIETFDLKSASLANISFDKTLREGSEPASKLPNEHDNVIVYYFGLSPLTAVSVKDLGKKVVNITGKVAGVGSGHSVEIQGKSGGANTCYLGKETTVETSSGAVDGTKYSPPAGEKVSMICTQEEGKEIAQFMQPFND